MFRIHQWTSDDLVHLTVLILLFVLFPVSEPLAHGLIPSFVPTLVPLFILFLRPLGTNFPFPLCQEDSSVLVCVLQRNKTGRVCVCVCV